MPVRCNGRKQSNFFGKRHTLWSTFWQRHAASDLASGVGAPIRASQGGGGSTARAPLPRTRRQRPGGATPSNVLLDSFSDFLDSILSRISSSVDLCVDGEGIDFC